jgi:hypothetical protein
MTLEQIVSTHPCPIIRGKIMENVNKERTYTYLDEILWDGFIWNVSPEGTKFWSKVSFDFNAPYSDLKHLDNSYVPEPAKPPVMWRKIDANNLCIDTVVAMHINEPTIIFMGSLELDRHNEITLYIGNGQYLPNFTHYIALSDLSSLPIE